MRVFGVLAALLLLAASWQWTDLGDLVAPHGIMHWYRGVRPTPSALLVTVISFVGASLLMVPVTLLSALAALAFGVWVGSVCSVVASLTSASISYGLGRVLWQDAVRRLGGQRLDRLSRGFAKRGLLGVALVRLVPVAPFTIVNLVAGASHVGFRDYFLGSVFAMTPGIVAISLIVTSAEATIRDPTPGRVAWVVALAAAFLAAGLWVRRKLRSRQK